MSAIITYNKVSFKQLNIIKTSLNNMGVKYIEKPNNNIPEIIILRKDFAEKYKCFVFEGAKFVWNKNKKEYNIKSGVENVHHDFVNQMIQEYASVVFQLAMERNAFDVVRNVNNDNIQIVGEMVI